MFDFLSMADNYEQRKVARYEKDNLIVDTCSANDSEQPYETGISHKSYNNGEWIVVETYDTQEQAEQGHAQWIAVMTVNDLPEKLVDVSSCWAVNQLRAMSDDVIEYKRQK